MKRFQFYLLCLFLASLMTACLPVASASFDLGKGHSFADMERAEAVAEKLGFKRRTLVINKLERIRGVNEEKYYSRFYVPGFDMVFGIGVDLYKNDGRLEVWFTENTDDDNFSTKGEHILQKLDQELREEFGNQVQQERKTYYIFAVHGGQPA
jgi:hypothetical protein